MIITQHPLWPDLLPYAALQEVPYDQHAATRRPRVRIEFVGLPLPLARSALLVSVPCVHCGQANNPFRLRAGQALRVGCGNQLYYACACRLEVSTGCSRGARASEAYAMVEAAIRARRVAVGVVQPGLGL